MAVEGLGPFYMAPSPVPINELLSVIQEEMAADIRDLDPTRMDAVTQFLSTRQPVGYPWQGRFVQKHVWSAAAQGPEATTLMSNRPDVNTVKEKLMREIVQWTLTHARIYMTFEFNGDEIAVLRAGQIPDAVEDWINDGRKTLQFEKSRMAYGDGSGCRAVVQAAALTGVSVLPLKRHDTNGNQYGSMPGGRYMLPNVIFEIRRGGVVQGSQVYVVTDYPRVQTSDGVDQITIRPSLDFDAAEDDELYFATDDVQPYGEEPGGLNIMYDDGNNHPVWKGINRWAYRNWGLDSSLTFTTSAAEGAAGYMQHADDVLLTIAIDHYKEVTGMLDITLLANGNVWREFPWGGAIRGTFPLNKEVPILDQRFGAQQVEAIVQGGLRQYRYYHPEVDVKRVNDPWAPYGQIIGVRPNELMEKQLESFGPMDPVYPETDTKKVRFVWRGNYDCESHGRNGLYIKRIALRDDGAPIHRLG